MFSFSVIIALVSNTFFSALSNCSLVTVGLLSATGAVGSVVGATVVGAGVGVSAANTLPSA